MGGFKRALFGYRRAEVEDAISIRDARILGLELNGGAARAALSELETETTSLTGMVLEREREIRCLNERLREANECHDRSIASLDAITSRLEEVEAQARGQATRIRMKALREAVEVSKKVKELTEIEPSLQAEADAPQGPTADESLYEGEVKLEIGPLGDFSQLVGFEDAVGQIGASEIKVDRFSEGRATFSMRLDEPTDLLSELEELSALDFKVRHTAPDNLILDVDEEQGPEQRAA
jgi:chromosome segregation ATPase